MFENITLKIYNARLVREMYGKRYCNNIENTRNVLKKIRKIVAGKLLPAGGLTLSLECTKSLANIGKK